MYELNKWYGQWTENSDGSVNCLEKEIEGMC